VDSFIEWFREEAVSIMIIVQQNRDYVYDLYSTNENMKIADNFMYDPLEFDLTSGSSSSPTAGFFSQYSSFSSIDLESMFLVIPSIVIGFLFGALLVNLWSKQFLQTWYYFKPRGLSYKTFSTSYLLYAISLAIIATPISSLLADIIENSILLGFGAKKLFFLSRFSNYLTLPLIISLVVAIWSFWRGMKHLEKLTIRETQTKQTDKSSFQWTRTALWLGAIGIILPFVVKSGIFSFSSISIAIELWFTIIFFVLIAFTPIAFLLGTTGFIASKTSLIESIFMKLINKLGFPTLKSSRGFNRQDFGFFIIIVFSFQFFLTLTTTNLLYVDEQQSFNTYGASYTSEFASIKSEQVELMKTTIEREFPQITEMWIHELLTCYESETGQKVLMYRFESTIPQSYKISFAKRNLLLEAIITKRGIILKSGKMFTDEKIIVEIVEDSNMTFNLLKNQLFLPGFTYPEGEQTNLESTLIPIPSEPNGIQLLIPDTIEILNVSHSRKIRFQFFSEEKSDNTVRQNIKSYFKEYTGEYIDVYIINESDSAKKLFYIIQTDLFTFFIIICFILLYISELTTKKGELGPYLCRGYSLRKIRFLFLFEGIILFSIAAISSLVIGSLLSAWVMVMVQYANLSVVLPILPSNIILNLFSLILLFLIIYYLILRVILRTEPIANYMRKSY